MNLADKAFLNILAKSSEAFFLLISSVVLVRYLTKTDYGTFLQIMLIVNTAIMFTFLGLPQSIFYYYHKVSNRYAFVIQNMVVSFFIGLAAALIAYLLRYQLARWLNNSMLSTYGWITALLIIFHAPSRLREPFLISQGSLIINSISTFLTNLIIYASMIIGVYFSVSLEKLLYIMIITAGVEFGIYLALMVRMLYQVRNFHSSDSQKLEKTIRLKDQFKYALPIGISSYIGVIGRQIDQYIVSCFFTPRDYAVYSRGAMHIPVLSSMQFTVNNIMMPQYVKTYSTGDIEGFLKHYHKGVEKIAKINFLFFSFLFAVSPCLMTFLYTKEYSDASNILRVYLFLLLIEITVYGIVPRASGKTSFVLYANMISIIMNIVISLMFVYLFGPIGAAIATILSYFITSLFLLSQSAQILGVTISKMFPWQYLKKLIAVSLFASLPIYGIDAFYYPVGNLQLFGFLVMYALIYLFCSVFLLMREGLIVEEDIAFLERWLRFDVNRLLRMMAFLK